MRYGTHPTRDPQFHVNMLEMHVDRRRRDVELRGELGSGAAVRSDPQHSEFACRQRRWVKLRAPPRKERSDLVAERRQRRPGFLCVSAGTEAIISTMSLTTAAATV